MRISTYLLIVPAILLLWLSACSQAQPETGLTAESTIRATLQRQTECWNQGDLNCFMKGYWESDSLRFIGKSGLKYGWQTTLDNYKKSYPDKEQMGQLSFDIISVEQTGPESAFVIGKWHLSRGEIGDLSGHYTLLWRLIEGEWVIVADHSS